MNQRIKDILEKIYIKYHRPEFIHPDPLEIVREYPDPGDREIAGLIASSFALGRVNAILDVVKRILSNFSSLKSGLLAATEKDLRKIFTGFKYRFYSDQQLIQFLLGIKGAIKTYGSLNDCFTAGMGKEKDIVQAITAFTSKINKHGGFLPDPSKKSACKRLFLFLKWMVRHDAIDPGGWQGIEKSSLIIPLDTHIFKIGGMLGFTRRRSADFKTACEVTEALKLIDPDDPVRFDFSLSRFGINPQLDYSEFSEMISGVVGNDGDDNS